MNQENKNNIGMSLVDFFKDSSEVDESIYIFEDAGKQSLLGIYL